MNHKTMAGLLRVVIIILGLCGVFMHLCWIPGAPSLFISVSKWWMILANVALIPCWIVLVIAWGIAGSISKEEEFCYRNAKRFRAVFYLALSDSIFFVAGSAVSIILEPWSFPLVFLAVPMAMLGLCVAICSAVMARLIEGAAKLQEETDLTI